MKKQMIPCMAAILLMASCGDENKVLVFNGKDLSNWTMFVADSSADPNEVFRAEDGVIKVSGIPNGYIRTKESYSNYTLHVEWRWTAEPKNSGVLLHTRGEDLLWPNSIECQLMNQHAGDIILIGNGAGVTVNDSSYTVPEGKRFQAVRKFEESSENPPGEWNSYDIICNGDNIEIRVNSVLQNMGTALTLTSGQIILQSEGGPIEFRNIYLIPLK
jgi:hypothetical protein